MNWKNESTWAAIGGALVTILAATGALTASESAQATTVLSSLTAAVIGAITLVRGDRFYRYVRRFGDAYRAADWSK